VLTPELRSELRKSLEDSQTAGSAR
jgi:hypothetical protein